jgi:hypothetical protein
MKDLKEILAKSPEEMTKEDLTEIQKAIYAKYDSPGNPHSNPGEYDLDPEEVAASILALKDDLPEDYQETVEINKALAAGKYTPGKGVFAKKYATDPYFPSR